MPTEIWKYSFFNQFRTYTAETQFLTPTAHQILQFGIIRKCSRHPPVDLAFITQSIHLNSVERLIDFVLVSLNVLSQF